MAGLSAALAAREQIARGTSLWRGAHLAGVLLMAGMVVVPFGLYLFFSHRGWAMLHWLDPADISAWQSLWIVCGAPLAGALGYLGGAVLVRVFRPLAAAIASGLGLVGLAIFVVLVRQRLFQLGDTGDLKESADALASDLTVVFAFAVPVLLGAWVFLLALFEVEGRKIQRATGIQASLESPASLSLAAAWEKSGQQPSEAQMILAGAQSTEEPAEAPASRSPSQEPQP